MLGAILWDVWFFVGSGFMGWAWSERHSRAREEKRYRDGLACGWSVSKPSSTDGLAVWRGLNV